MLAGPSRRPPAAELAARYGLTPVGRRPPFVTYLRDIWARRHFIVRLAHSRALSNRSRDRLGSLWLILTPLLLGALYYFLFGQLLQTKQGIDNFLGYLMIGVFLAHYTSRSLTAGARSIISNQSLMRHVRFPRAILPLAVVVQAAIVLIPALGVMIAVVLAMPPTEPVNAAWLVLVPALLIQTVFTIGLALIAARIVSLSRDLLNLLPFVTRTWIYLSAVFYSYERFIDRPQIIAIFEANPLYVFLLIARTAVLDGAVAPLHLWVQVSVWAVGLFVVGIFLFWHSEERYARD